MHNCRIVNSSTPRSRPRTICHSAVLRSRPDTSMFHPRDYIWLRSHMLDTCSRTRFPRSLRDICSRNSCRCSQHRRRTFRLQDRTCGHQRMYTSRRSPDPMCRLRSCAGSSLQIFLSGTSNMFQFCCHTLTEYHRWCSSHSSHCSCNQTDPAYSPPSMYLPPFLARRHICQSSVDNFRPRSRS